MILVDWIHRYRTIHVEESHICRANYKLYAYFQMCRGSAHLTSTLFKGQWLYLHTLSWSTCFPYNLFNTRLSFLGKMYYISIAQSMASRNISSRIPVSIGRQNIAGLSFYNRKHSWPKKTMQCLLDFQFFFRRSQQWRLKEFILLSAEFYNLHCLSERYSPLWKLSS